MSAIPLAQRVGRIKPSPTLAITAKAKALKAQGVDVVGFGAGEPDFDTPDFVKQAAIAALNAGKTKYTEGAGMPELRDALCRLYKTTEGLDYKRTESIVSNGGKHALFNIFQAILNDGDEVIIPIPYWVSYPDMAMLAGAKPVFLGAREENGFAFSSADVERLITPKTKAMVVNSPSNPSGMALPEVLLAEICKLAVKYNFFIVWDEIYKDVYYGQGRLRSLPALCPEARDHILLCGGLSKSFSMTGWRIGWTLGEERVIKAMSMIQDQSTSNPVSFAQYGALAALEKGPAHIGPWLTAFRERRDTLVAGLNSIPGTTCLNPQGAFYVFPNVSGWFGKKWDGGVLANGSDVATYLLEKARVAVVPGDPFGCPSNIRISYALSMADVKKGLDRIREAALAL